MTDINRIDLNLLRVFDLLMTEGSVSRVAVQLKLSQSTISHALARLRRQFQDELFLPVHGGVAPTEQARAMAPVIRQAMLLLDQGLNRRPVYNPAESQQKFRLAGGDYVELMLLPVLMEQLEQNAPEIRVELESLKASDYARELESGEVDLVIGFEQPDHLSHRLRHSFFLDEELVVVSSTPLTKAFSPVTAEQIQSLKFIYPSNWGHSQALMDQWCQQQGIERNIAVRVTGFVAVPRLMQKLDMVTVLPSAVAKYYQRCFNFTWHPLANTHLTYRHQLAWHPLKDSDPGLLWLRKQILEAAKIISPESGLSCTCDPLSSQ